MYVVFACVWRLWSLCVCVRSWLLWLGVAPHPWNKVIDLGAKHKSSSWHSETRKFKEKNRWPKSDQFNKKTILFLSGPRVPNYLPPSSGGGFLYTFCVWHLGARPIYYSVCHMLNIDAVFLCTCMVSVVFVCVSGIDCCDLRVPPTPPSSLK